MGVKIGLDLGRMFELVKHFGVVCVTPGRIGVDGAEEDALEPEGDVWVEFGGLGGRFVKGGRLKRFDLSIREAPAQHTVEGHADGVDFGRFTQGGSAETLGGQIAGGSGAPGVRVGFGDATKIEHDKDPFATPLAS